MKPGPKKSDTSTAQRMSISTQRPNNPQPTNKDSKEIFLKKLALCSQHLDFNDEKKNVAEKEERLQCLADLQEMISNQALMSNVLVPHLDQVIGMVKKNLFRPLPIVKKQGVSGENGMGDEDEVILDPSWPHLQPVYEFFL